MKLVICKKKKSKKKTGSFSPTYCSYCKLPESTATGKKTQSEPGLCLMECLTAVNLSIMLDQLIQYLETLNLEQHVIQYI